MGTSTSWAQLDRKLEALARDAADMPKGQVGRSALITKKSVQAFMPGRLRGVGKKGAKLTVKYNEHGEGEEATALVFVNGPLQLIERDTKRHQIPRQRSSASFEGVFGKAVLPAAVTRRSGKGQSRVFTRVMHPGTKGKHPWAKGVEAAVPLINREFDAAGFLLLRRHF